MESVIKIKDLTKSYRLYANPFDRVKETFDWRHKSYGKEKIVLNHLNLTINKGDVIGIIGTNGAGKSTLLKLITGVLTPTEGTIEVKGKVSALLELGTGFNPEFTGIKNIYLNGTMMGFTREEMDNKLQDIINFADIGDFIEQPVKTYSSGMFARLAFAVAINVDPDILIVDEALSVGDIRFQMKCMDKIKSMMDTGVTTLFVSHDINTIRRFCTETLWLKQGELQAFGETNSICDMYMDFLKKKDENKEESIQTEQLQVKDPVKKAEAEKKKKEGIVGEISQIDLYDKYGNKKEKFDLFEPMTVEVKYNVFDEDITYPVLGIAVKRVDDEYICGVNTLLDDMKIPWNEGENTFCLTYQEGIRVLGGGYYFDIAIFDKTATVPIQYKAKCKEFTVTADYIGEGIFIVPHIWGSSNKL